MTPPLGRALLLFAALLSTSCAARSGATLRAVDLARADQLLRDGCYDCLLEARGLYEGAGASARRAVLVRLLEVELLLALREKELAIDETATMARAAALVSELGAAADAEQYLAIVAAIPPDAAGTPRVLRPPPAALTQGEGDAATLAAIASSPFSAIVRDYLSLAVRCSRWPLDPGPLPAPAAARSPLFAYRLAVCSGRVDVAALEQVRADVPRFVETSLFLGRAAMASFAQTDGSRVRALYEEAYERFPNSSALTFHLGIVMQAGGDCRRADGYFTETLVLRPQHEDARLGRAVCRTYLSMTDAAIADATVLIDAGAGNRAEAYYWRAWNRRTQKRLPMARADIDAARALQYNARVLTLAGMIEHDQAEFDTAKEDLTRARQLDARECQARWYLGLVGYATEAWAESAAGFADAADCYARLIAETDAQRTAMAARDDVSAEFRATQIAGFTAAIAEDSTQKSAADLNAAINYARAGDVEQATVYMKRAVVDPERAGAVEDLRQVLGVPRW